MKKFIFAAVVLAGAALGGGQSAFAATTPAFDPTFADFMAKLKTIESANYSNTVSAVGYKPDTDEAVNAVVFVSKGISREQEQGANFYETKGSTKMSAGYEEDGYEITMDIVAKGNNVYIRFPEADNSKLRGKWIKLSYSQYLALGKALEKEALFDQALESQSDSDLESFEETTTLGQKHKMYVPFGEPLEEKINGVDMVGYQYEYNRATVVAYFKALKKTLSREELEDSFFGFEGFEKGLNKKAFVDEFVDRSVVTLWYNKKTNVPTGVSTFTVIPESGKRREEVQLNVEMFLNNPNLKVSVKEPKEFITFTEAQKILKVKIKM